MPPDPPEKFLAPLALGVQPPLPNLSSAASVEEDLCKDYFQYIMETEDWNYPVNVEDAFNLFQSLNNL